MFSSDLERSRRRSGKADENGGQLTPPTSRQKFAPSSFCRVFSLFCYFSIPNIFWAFHSIYQVFGMFPNHKNIFGRFYDCVPLYRYATVSSTFSKLCPMGWSLYRWWICRWILFRCLFVLCESWTEMLLKSFLRTLPCFPVCVLQRHIQTEILCIHLLLSIDSSVSRILGHLHASSCMALL